MTRGTMQHQNRSKRPSLIFFCQPCWTSSAGQEQEQDTRCSKSPGKEPGRKQTWPCAVDVVHVVPWRPWPACGFRLSFWKPFICLQHSGHCRPSLMGGSLSSRNQCRQPPCRCWCTGSCTCHESTLPSEPYRRRSHQSNPYRSCSSWCKGSLQHRSGHSGSMHRQRPSFHHASTHLGPFRWCRHHLQCWPPHLHPLQSKHRGSSPLSCHAADSVPGCNLHLLHMNHPTPVPPKWIQRFLQQPIQGQESSPGTWWPSQDWGF